MKYITSFGETELSSLGPEPTIHPTARITDSWLGEWTEINREVRIHESELGRYSYLMERCQLDYTTIGKFNNVASDVRLGPTNHPMSRPTQHHVTYRQRMYALNSENDESVFEWRRDQPVKIGHDVWIGHGATVMPNVSVGNGAVIGAGAVVTHDVAPYTIVAGIPARPIRRRFTEDIAETLESVAWWDWSRETIEHRFDELIDMDAFLEKYG